MCAIFLLAAAMIAVIVAFVIFVKTAVVLLPWSLSAAVLAVLAGVLIGKFAMRSAKPQLAMPASLCTTFVLTLALGYIGCSLIPPKISPANPQRGDLRDVFDMPGPSQEKLEEHMPTHFAIAALMSAAAVALLWPVVAKHDGDQAVSISPDC